jgi:hypothetical protein
MTKKERADLARAVRLLWDDKWEEGMGILLPMAGLRSPAIESAKNARPVSIQELMSGPHDLTSP